MSPDESAHLICDVLEAIEQAEAHFGELGPMLRAVAADVSHTLTLRLGQLPVADVRADLRGIANNLPNLSPEQITAALEGGNICELLGFADV